MLLLTGLAALVVLLVWGDQLFVAVYPWLAIEAVAVLHVDAPDDQALVEMRRSEKDVWSETEALNLLTPYWGDTVSVQLRVSWFADGREVVSPLLSVRPGCHAAVQVARDGSVRLRTGDQWPWGAARWRDERVLSPAP